MSEMVERVELVLHDFLQGEMTIPEAARAAIEAMREPTEAMVDPLDLDAIEKEARAYVEANGHKFADHSTLLFDYVVGLLAAVRERDAEIARLTTCAGEDALTLCELNSALNELRAPPGADVLERAERLCVTVGLTYREEDGRDVATVSDRHVIALALQQYGDERAAEQDAEIARLTGLATYDHGHNEPCLMCGKPCNSLAGNPALWALRLGNDGWHHTGCVNAALRELDRLRAPPGADAMERAGRLIVDLCGGEPLREDDSDILPTACALQQYGDERAREATDQANMVYELHNRLVGHVEMDAESRAEWVMKQSLDGLHIGENNRGSIRDYLAGHFQQAMVDAAAAARAAAIEAAAQYVKGRLEAARNDGRLAAKPGSQS